MSKSTPTDYVLGVTREEYERLGLQHSLWKSRAIKLWKRAGLKENTSREMKVIDCGCGPGFTTYELAKYLGEKSKVVGIDLAEKYIKILESRYEGESEKKKKKIARIETLNASLETFSLEDKDFDAAYARWIFIFLKNPEAAIKNISNHLKPGGLFLLQEYVDYSTMALHPESPVFKKMVAGIIKSWADQGGDANVAGKLPALLAKNGFEIIRLKPQARVGMPHEKIWQWPDSFYKNYIPVLEKGGYLSNAEASEFWKVWTQAEKSPHAFYVGPTVLDIIARKY